jgi:hypothetical protein
MDYAIRTACEYEELSVIAVTPEIATLRLNVVVLLVVTMHADPEFAEYCRALIDCDAAFSQLPKTVPVDKFIVVKKRVITPLPGLETGPTNTLKL